MAMTKEVLNNNTTEQLHAKCDELKVVYSKNTTRNELVSRLIKASSHESHQTTETNAKEGTCQPDAPVQGTPAKGNHDEAVEAGSGISTNELMPNTLSPKTDRCWFKVSAGQKADEKGPVFAAINGESILIHRNTWVQLKTKFLPIFTDAITSEVVILDDAKSVVRDVPRFNYEIRSLSDGKPKDGKAPIGF